jgi:hypothetical protein
MKTNSIQNDERIQTDWFEVPGGRIYRTFYQNSAIHAEEDQVAIAMCFVPNPPANEFLDPKGM